MGTGPAVLITGASGFVGRHLLSALSSALPAARAIPVSRREGISIDGRPAVRLDLEQPDSFAPFLKAQRPDIVVHLSGEAFGPRAAANPMAAWQSNFWQTLEFAEAIRTTRPECVFVFISSADIYGLTVRPGHPVVEDQGMAPANPYGATKAATDLALGEMALRGLRTIRLRPFNHTGPGQSSVYVIPTLAHQIALIEAGRQEPIIRIGNLDAARDFLDVRDVCAAYVNVIEQAQTIPTGEAFNIASGEPRRIGDILRQLTDIAGIDPKIETNADRLRASEIPSVCGDSSKIRERLGWRPMIPFERTLSDTLDWWRGQVRV